MGKKKKPDIGSALGGILQPRTDEDKSTRTREDESARTQEHEDEHTRNRISTRTYDSMNAGSSSNEPSAPRPERSQRSYMLPDDVIEMIDDLHYLLNKRFDAEIEKSHIVEASVRYIYNDYEQDREESIIAEIIDRLQHLS